MCKYFHILVSPGASKKTMWFLDIFRCYLFVGIKNTSCFCIFWFLIRLTQPKPSGWWHFFSLVWFSAGRTSNHNSQPLVKGRLAKALSSSESNKGAKSRVRKFKRQRKRSSLPVAWWNSPFFGPWYFNLSWKCEWYITSTNIHQHYRLQVAMLKIRRIATKIPVPKWSNIKAIIKIHSKI